MSRTDPRPHYGRKWRVRVDGYIDWWEPDHPLAREDGYLFEHRRVLYDAGVALGPDDEVHHANGIKTDNRVENLVVVDKREHASIHAREHPRGWAAKNAAKTHCVNGHDITDPDNVYASQLPYRVCKLCARERSRMRVGTG